MPSINSFADYFRQHRPVRNPKSFGAAAAVRKVSPDDFELPQVCWLENGILAIHAHQYLFSVYQYIPGETLDFYFVVDFKTEQPSITGLCR